MISLDRGQALTALALLLIAGAALGVALERSGDFEWASLKAERESTLSDGAPPVSGVLLEGANAVAVNDQPPGSLVNVSFVAFAQGGWVVIREERGGAPGAILGARRFDAGTGQSGQVELLRPTEEGSVYFAALAADDGDRQFDHTKDRAIEDGQGNPILVRFVATAAPAE